MSLSIGQLMKGLMGDSQPADSKALELKVGQVVRAVLVKMLDDQEGIIQINGTQVQAKLETPLQPGQSTLLQVQPQSLDGTLVLKQVDQQAAMMPEATMKEWLKAAGLPEQKWTAQLVNDLKREGVPLTRETAAQFKQALAEMPQAADAKTWMNAASLAAKRGLPMTSATISALAQVQSGAPAHVLLEALERGLAAWDKAVAGQSGAGRSGGRMAGTGQSADETAAQSGGGREGAGRSGDATAGQSGGRMAGAGMQSPTAAQAAAAKLQALLTDGAALMREAPGGSGAGAQPAPADSPAAGEAAAALSARSADAGASSAAPSARAGGAAASGAAPQAAAVPAAPAQPNPTAAAAAAPSSGGGTQAPSPNGSDGAPTPQPAAPQNWVGQLMKWLGVDYERLLAASATEDQLLTTPKLANQPSEAAPEQQQLQFTNASDAKEPARGIGNAASALVERALQHQQQQANQLPAPGQAPVQEAVKHAAAETMKSALMTIASSDEVPQALRDTAQQLVSHITGQQLLLSPEKTGSLFSHVTMFIPMKGADGSQTASVHIQTRRGRKGELDADNCRLLFDLRMKALGDTVVDVQVVDKIVSVNLWNDHPMTGELVESSRTELTEALQKAGYQLLTLKATPMPDRMAARMNGTDSSTTVSQTNGQGWSAKPYKGVDFRA